MSSKRGVAVHDPERASKGYNLYTAAHAQVAFLLDMEGKEIHRWAFDVQDVFPRSVKRRHSHDFRRVHVLESGDLLATYDYIGIVRLSADSKLQRKHYGRCHHHLGVDEQGNVYVLAQMERVVPWIRSSPAGHDPGRIAPRRRPGPECGERLLFPGSGTRQVGPVGAAVSGGLRVGVASPVGTAATRRVPHILKVCKPLPCWPEPLFCVSVSPFVCGGETLATTCTCCMSCACAPARVDCQTDVAPSLEA